MASASAAPAVTVEDEVEDVSSLCSQFAAGMAIQPPKPNKKKQLTRRQKEKQLARAKADEHAQLLLKLEPLFDSNVHAREMAEHTAAVFASIEPIMRKHPGIDPTPLITARIAKRIEACKAARGVQETPETKDKSNEELEQALFGDDDDVETGNLLRPDVTRPDKVRQDLINKFQSLREDEQRDVANRITSEEQMQARNRVLAKMSQEDRKNFHIREDRALQMQWEWVQQGVSAADHQQRRDLHMRQFAQLLAMDSRTWMSICRYAYETGALKMDNRNSKPGEAEQPRPRAPPKTRFCLLMKCPTEYYMRFEPRWSPSDYQFVTIDELREMHKECDPATGTSIFFAELIERVQAYDPEHEFVAALQVQLMQVKGSIKVRDPVPELSKKERRRNKKKKQPAAAAAAAPEPGLRTVEFEIPADCHPASVTIAQDDMIDVERLLAAGPRSQLVDTCGFCRSYILVPMDDPPSCAEHPRFTFCNLYCHSQHLVFHTAKDMLNLHAQAVINKMERDQVEQARLSLREQKAETERVLKEASRAHDPGADEQHRYTQEQSLLRKKRLEKVMDDGMAEYVDKTAFVDGVAGLFADDEPNGSAAAALPAGDS